LAGELKRYRLEWIRAKQHEEEIREQAERTDGLYLQEMKNRGKLRRIFTSRDEIQKRATVDHERVKQQLKSAKARLQSAEANYESFKKRYGYETRRLATLPQYKEFTSADIMARDLEVLTSPPAPAAVNSHIGVNPGNAGGLQGGFSSAQMGGSPQGPGFIGPNQFNALPAHPGAYGVQAQQFAGGYVPFPAHQGAGAAVGGQPPGSSVLHTDKLTLNEKAYDEVDGLLKTSPDPAIRYAAKKILRLNQVLSAHDASLTVDEKTRYLNLMVNTYNAAAAGAVDKRILGELVAKVGEVTSTLQTQKGKVSKNKNDPQEAADTQQDAVDALANALGLKETAEALNPPAASGTDPALAAVNPANPPAKTGKTSNDALAQKRVAEIGDEADALEETLEKMKKQQASHTASEKNLKDKKEELKTAWDNLETERLKLPRGTPDDTVLAYKGAKDAWEAKQDEVEAAKKALQKIESKVGKTNNARNQFFQSIKSKEQELDQLLKEKYLLSADDDKKEKLEKKYANKSTRKAKLLSLAIDIENAQRSLATRKAELQAKELLLADTDTDVKDQKARKKALAKFLKDMPTLKKAFDQADVALVNVKKKDPVAFAKKKAKYDAAEKALKDKKKEITDIEKLIEDGDDILIPRMADKGKAEKKVTKIQTELARLKMQEAVLNNMGKGGKAAQASGAPSSGGSKGSSLDQLTEDLEKVLTYLELGRQGKDREDFVVTKKGVEVDIDNNAKALAMKTYLNHRLHKAGYEYDPIVGSDEVKVKPKAIGAK
jgi:hypothetical protein